MRFLLIAFVLTATTVSAQTRSTASVSPPYFGGIPSGTASATPLQLTILETINRALQHNLGVLDAEEAVNRARGTRWTALGELLPTIGARVSETRQIFNFAAFGVNPQNFGFPAVIGPFNLFDGRVALSQAVVDVHAMNSLRAENHNIAAENRQKLIEMVATWYVEAGKYDVLPIDSRGTLRLADERPQIALPRTSYTYYPVTQAVPANASPRLLNRPHSITADVEIPKGGAEGALLSFGDVTGGFCFYVQSGKLHYVYNYAGSQFYHIESNTPVPEGRHKLRFEFEVTGKPDISMGKGAPGRGLLYIDGNPDGQGDIPVTLPLAMGL